MNSKLKSSRLKPENGNNSSKKKRHSLLQSSMITMACAASSTSIHLLHLSSPPFSSTRPIKNPKKPYFSSKTSSNRSSSTAKTLVVRCSSSEPGETPVEPRLRDLISGMVDEQVEELLKSEENKVLLNDLEKATQRVNDARNELAEIERQERDSERLKDYVRKLETRTSEIAECQRELLEARAMVEEADRTLSLNMDEIRSGDASNNSGTYEIDKEVERLESIKASIISALVGTLVGLPISLSQSTSFIQLIFHLAVNFISCALFGVTFRYAVRRDLDNIQLKTGISAAFGFVKGLAELEAGSPLEFDGGSFFSHAVDGAVYVSENLFIFIFASIGLDYCFKMSLLSPFPIKRSISQKGQ